MDTNNTPPPAPPSSPSPSAPPSDSPKAVGLAEVQALIDASTSRDKAVLEFFQSQLKSDREFFEAQLAHVKWFGGIVVTIAVGFMTYAGFTSTKDITERFERSLQSSLGASQKKIDEQIRAFSEEASSTIKSESQKVRETVRDRVNDEISRPAVQSTIDYAVQTAARSKVATLVSNELNPVREQIRSFNDLMSLNTLVLKAQTGERKAYEDLASIGRGEGERARFARESREFIAGALAVSAQLINRFPHPTLERLQSSASVDEMRRTLQDSSNPELQIAAINLMREHSQVWEKKFALIPVLVQLALTDPNLRVAATAHLCLNETMGVGLKDYKMLDARFFDNSALQRWWEQYKNRPEFK